MNEPIVKVEHLSHRYSIQWAIRDINFEITQKGIYGLLGSNGAGKSTTMNIISGVIKQTKGNVFIKGVDIRKNSVESKRKLGFLPQKPPLYNDLTVEEFLMHSAGLRWMDKKEIKPAVDEVLERCGITHFRNRLIKNLSGGYQQRVGIAQAIVHKPDLVILDEPTNGLDPNQIVEIRNLIKEIAMESTVILSTHILPEVQAACDHILMIEEGRVVFAGTVDEFDNYIVPNTLYVSMLNGPSADVFTKLGGVLRAEELGNSRYRIYFSEPHEVIDNIVDMCSRERYHLLELKIEKSSLDTIFAELSKKH